VRSSIARYGHPNPGDECAVQAKRTVSTMSGFALEVKKYRCCQHVAARRISQREASLRLRSVVASRYAMKHGSRRSVVAAIPILVTTGFHASMTKFARRAPNLFSDAKWIAGADASSAATKRECRRLGGDRLEQREYVGLANRAANLRACWKAGPVP